MTIELRKVGTDGDRAHITAFIAKNKLGGRIGTYAEFDIVSTEGIDYAQHILKLATEFGIIQKNGAWVYYPSKDDPQYRAQGDANAKKALPIAEIADKVRGFIKEYVTDGEDESATESDD